MDHLAYRKAYNQALENSRYRLRGIESLSSLLKIGKSSYVKRKRGACSLPNGRIIQEKFHK